MKKSYIIGGIVALAVVAAGSFAIFWPKTPVVPGVSEEHHETPSSEQKVDGVEAVNTTHQEPASAAPTAPLDANSVKMKKIDTFLQHSRLRDEFQAMDGLLKDQLDEIQDAAQLSAADQEELEKIKAMVESKRLLENVTKLMNERFSEEQLDKLNTIYENPLMASLQEAKAHNQTQEGQRALLPEFKTFKAESLPADTLAALKEYDKQSGGTESTLAMMDSVSQMTGNHSKDPKMQKEQENMRKTMRTAIEHANLFTNYSAMKNNSAQEINSINKLVADPVVRTMNGIQQEVIQGAIHEMGKVVNAKAEHHERKRVETK